MRISSNTVDTTLELANQEISNYLEAALREHRIDRQLYEEAKKHTFPNLRRWLDDANIDGISPNLKQGLSEAIQGGQWENIVNAFRRGGPLRRPGGYAG